MFGNVEVALDHLARLQINDHHVGSLHRVVAYARRFDDDQSFLAVDTRDVAPGKDDQSLPDQVQVGLEYFLFQFFQHSISV